MTARMLEKTSFTVISLCLCLALLALGGCGQTVPPITTPATGEVDTYFGGPFVVTINPVGISNTSIDHSGNQLAVSAFVNNSNILVPTQVLSGTFSTADTGFLTLSENFATTTSGYGPQNPPLPGAWAVELPGAGALANFLAVNNSNIPSVVSAAPAAMADNTACPFFTQQTGFLYVNVPISSNVTSSDTSNYGIVGISTQGSTVTFSAAPYLIGPLSGIPSVLAGGCSNSTLGAVTAYPMNSFGQRTNVELISIGKSGLLVSSFNAQSGTTSPGAFGGGNGVIGVLQPSSPVDESLVVNAKYNGFMYAPADGVAGTYDIRVLASAFGNHAGNSPACATLQASLEANHNQGAGTVPSLPYTDTIYGGEFLSVDTSGNTVNDPSGQLGSENCDVAVTLGIQDPENPGLFPNATIFIGSNYPPFSASNPWNCFGTSSVCAVSFPAAAIVGEVQGHFVIFVAASSFSNPAAQLPDGFGNAIAQPFGVYLFQKP